MKYVNDSIQAGGRANVGEEATGMSAAVGGGATRGPARCAPPGARTLTAQGWQQEAALRMLQNNLDPEVAEHPEELVVYGGTGKAARNWRVASTRCVRTLRDAQAATRRCWCSPASRSA